MLSPAWPSSSSLRNISTPVQVVLVRVLDADDLDLFVADLDDAGSIRPVTTVPRPEIENTSSIGIRKSLSTGTVGSGM